MFQFSCRFAFFINFSSSQTDTENNANFDTVSSKHANFEEAQFFKHVLKLIKWHTNLFLTCMLF